MAKLQNMRMQTLACAILISFGMQGGASIEAAPTPVMATPPAQIDGAPNPAKLELIRQFLDLIGIQHQLDTGSFLERYAMPGGPMWAATPGEPLQEALADGFRIRFEALKMAYARRRAAYQQDYEDHLNWEFTEDELREIVAFLSKPVGKHYLDGRWRMEAYTRTNTEEMDEDIVKEALASFKK